MEHCRIYVCKTEFGRRDECIKFKTLFDYYKWKDASEYSYLYSFQPICTYISYFDKSILQFRNTKFESLSIRDF